MKTTRLMALVLSLLIAASQTAFAASVSTSAVPVTASVDSQLSLSMVIKEETDTVNHIFGPAVTSMAHGTLTRNTNPDGSPGALSGKTFHAFLGTNTSSRPYTVLATMNALTSGAVALPRALGGFPGSAKVNATDTVNTGTLAAAHDAVATNKVIYTSNAAGAGVTIDYIYAISGGTATGVPFTGFQAIPPGQTAGTYSSSITFTLTV
jgi:hypothetical protein